MAQHSKMHPRISTAAENGGPEADPPRALQDLRDELDGIDARLLEDLRARLACCGRIGQHKKQHGVPMMQPHRIGIVQARAAAFAATHGLSDAFLRELYELIIAETCRLEDEIIGSPGDGLAEGQG